SVSANPRSGCGWPAFDKCFKGSVVTETDNAYGMRRVEIMCAACGGHLGHVMRRQISDTHYPPYYVRPLACRSSRASARPRRTSGTASTPSASSSR
ncbi:unnamed protein product, partial [Laminaria digitata]